MPKSKLSEIVVESGLSIDSSSDHMTGAEGLITPNELAIRLEALAKEPNQAMIREIIEAAAKFFEPQLNPSENVFFKLLGPRPGYSGYYLQDIMAFRGTNTLNAFLENKSLVFLANLKTGKASFGAHLPAGCEKVVYQTGSDLNDGSYSYVSPNSISVVNPLENNERLQQNGKSYPSDSMLDVEKQKTMNARLHAGQHHLSTGDDSPGVPPPPVFNTTRSNAMPKDFASIFNDANYKLYSKKASKSISVSLPGTANKSYDLGIHNDRATVISSTSLSEVLGFSDFASSPAGMQLGIDPKKEVYNKLILDRYFKLQAAYEKLALVDEDAAADAIENYNEMMKSIRQGIETVIQLAEADEEANILALEKPKLIAIQNLIFAKGKSLTQYYLQTLYDLGRLSQHGYPKSPDGVAKRVGSENPDFKISRTTNAKISSEGFWDIITAGLKEAHSGNSLTANIGLSPTVQTSQIIGGLTDPLNYRVSQFGSFLAYQNEINPILNLNTPLLNEDMSKANYVFAFKVTRENIAQILQTIYTELTFSKLYTSGDETIVSLREAQIPSRERLNLALHLMPQMKSANKDLTNITVSDGLTSILRFGYSGTDYYPFEEVIPKTSGIEGKTFLESVIQPAVGALIEGEEPDYTLLNAWLQNSKNELKDYFSYTDLIYNHGGAAIMFNEIVLALTNFVGYPQASPGTQHPLLSQFTQETRDKLQTLLPAHVFKILKMGLGQLIQTRNTSQQSFMPMVYNTFGFCIYEGIGDVARTMFASQTSAIQSHGYDTAMTAINAAHLGTAGIGELSSVNQNVLALLDAAVADSDDDTGHTADQWDPTLVAYENTLAMVPELKQDLETFFAIFAALFGSLESGIMNSIDLLLAEQGFISPTSAPSYDEAPTGFFVPSTDFGIDTTFGDSSDENIAKAQEISGALLPSQTYQVTAFSGIPYFAIRCLLAKCLAYIAIPPDQDILTPVETSAGSERFMFENHNALIKAARLAVENLDPAVGPLRYKVTHGDWPIKDFSDISRDLYDKLKPIERQVLQQAGERPDPTKTLQTMPQMK